MESKIGDLSQYQLEIEYYENSEQWREKRWRDLKSNKIVRYESYGGFYWERTYDKDGNETSCYTNIGGWEKI